MIQRAGRLQRHTRDERGARLRDSNARDQRGEPCLWVFGPAWVDGPPARWFKAAFPRAAGVYPNHAQIWQTAKLLQLDRIAMPEDARQLIESVFGDAAVIPEGLQSNANTAEGRGYADASVAQQNTVKLASGYVRGGIDWWSEAKTPSRLGEASMNVMLARWEGDRLRPWADGKHGWAYSGVRVAERLIAEAVPPPTPARRAALEQLLPTLPNKGKWSVLLALDKTVHGWVGQALNRPPRDRPVQKLTWCYDRQMGLRQVEASTEEDE